MTTAKNQTKYTSIGNRPVRHDGYDKVTGKAQYGADVDLPGLIHGKILRSPHAHAKIVSIDTSKAERLSGVKAIVTREDFADLPSEFVLFLRLDLPIQLGFSVPFFIF